MTEDQIMLAEKIRGFTQSLRGQGLILVGQVVFAKVTPNTMANPENTEAYVVVTNNDGKYIFDVVKDWPNGLTLEEDQAYAEAEGSASKA